MSTITDNLRDPSWWITVVLFGLAVNLLASYAKPAVDRAISALSSWFSNQRQRHSTSLDKEIADIRSSADYRISTQLLKIEYLVKFFGAVAFTIYIGRLAGHEAAEGGGQTYRMLGGVSGWYAAACFGRYSRFSDTLARAWRQEKANRQVRAD